MRTFTAYLDKERRKAEVTWKRSTFSTFTGAFRKSLGGQTDVCTLPGSGLVVWDALVRISPDVPELQVDMVMASSGRLDMIWNSVVLCPSIHQCSLTWPTLIYLHLLSIRECFSSVQKQETLKTGWLELETLLSGAWRSPDSMCHWATLMSFLSAEAVVSAILQQQLCFLVS